MEGSSALVDLKAELSRKEHEANDRILTRSANKVKGNKTFAKIKEATKSKKYVSKKKEVESTREVPDETLKLLEEARQKLEAKSKLYDRLANGEIEDREDLDGETRFLVDFDRKYYTDVDEENEFDEKRLDNTLESNFSLDLSSATDGCSRNSSLLFEMNESQREKMREKWKEEKEELGEAPVHYQNIECDEIRELGTGYFAFSKNEEERQKQIEDLQNLRKSTNTAQNKRESLKRKRKDSLQERLNKIKAKKYGISPSQIIRNSSEQYEEGNMSSSFIDDKDSSFQQSFKGEVTDILIINASTPEPPINRSGMQNEREWDKGKDHIPVKSSSTKLHCNYLKMKAEERNEEFAPPNGY